MTSEHARAAAIKHCLEFVCAPDPAARDETPKPDNERSARTCCGDSPRSIDRRAVSRAAQPDPTRDNGNHATAPEQTIDGATPLNRDPCHNSFCPSEDKRCFSPVAVSRGGNHGGDGGFIDPDAKIQKHP